MSKISEKIKKGLFEVIVHAKSRPTPRVRIHNSKINSASKVPNAITIAAMKEGRQLAGQPGRTIQELFDDLDKLGKRKS